MRYKGRVIAANRRRGIEKGSFHVLLDVADFGGVFLHTVQYKADMLAVQLHKLCFYKLCRVVVPCDTDCSSFGADGFKDKGKDFLYPVPVKVSVLYQIVVLDIVLDDFLIHSVSVVPFASVPAAVPRPLRERDLGNGKEWNGYLIYLYLIFLCLVS